MSVYASTGREARLGRGVEDWFWRLEYGDGSGTGDGSQDCTILSSAAPPRATAAGTGEVGSPLLATSNALPLTTLRALALPSTAM